MPVILIGLTGGIACGKSTVSSILQDEFHIPVIDADLIVRELQGPGAPCTRRIGKRWPVCVDEKTGELRREALGRIVFSDSTARRELAKIMNGPIFMTILRRILSFWWKGLLSTSQQVVVLDAPTLFETKLFTFLVSGSVVVACSEARQVQRLVQRNKMLETEALDRIRSQMPLEKKRSLAGFVIENDTTDDMSALRHSVRLAAEWMSKQGKHKLTVVVGSVLTVGVAAAVIAALCVKRFLGE